MWWCAQVGYSEQNTDYTLYLVAGSHTERLQWINAIRTGMFIEKKNHFVNTGILAVARDYEKVY